MENNDDFQKRAFELWMAVTMFMSTYAKESNGVVKNVSAMLPYATDLQNFWSAYQSAQSNDLIRKLHTKVRSRVKLMQDSLNESIRLCENDQRLLDKYSENQSYIERKLNEVYALIPKEPRKVKEPEQMTLDFDESPSRQVPRGEESEPKHDEDDGMKAKSERFLRRLNELRTSVNGFLSSYPDESDSVVSYVSDMDSSIKVIDGLWRRYVGEQGGDAILDGLNDSMRKCIESLKRQCEMSMLVRDSSKCSGKYEQNHDYVVKKLNEFVKAFPDGMRK